MSPQSNRNSALGQRSPSYVNSSCQNRFKCCNLHDLIHIFFDNGVINAPKRRILSFVFTVLCFKKSLSMTKLRKPTCKSGTGEAVANLTIRELSHSHIPLIQQFWGESLCLQTQMNKNCFRGFCETGPRAPVRTSGPGIARINPEATVPP